MENVLSKALKEVLTPRYSEELRDAFDTGYKFSDEFEQKMRVLIRKTERPVNRYIGLIAAAACAVIAIGCAVLIPVLNNNSIPVDDNAQTSQTSADNVATVETSAFSVTTPVTESGDNVISALPVSDVTTDKTETDVPIDTTAPASSSQITTDTSVSGDKPLVVDDDDEGDDFTSEDDDVAIDEDDDVVIDVVDTDVTDEISITAEDGEKLGDVMNRIIEGFSFENKWAGSAQYSPEGSGPSVRADNINFYDFDYDYIQDVVHGIGDAEVYNEGFSHSGSASLTVWLQNSKTNVRDITRIMYNGSAWLEYNSYYNIEDSDFDVDISEDPDDIADEDNDSIILTFYENGYVVADVKHYVKDDDGNVKLYKLGSTYYRMDSDRCSALFDKLEARYIPDTVKTVGDIADKMNITADNLTQANVTVECIYDTDLYRAKIGTDFIEKLLKDHAGQKLTNVHNGSTETDINGEIHIEFYTKESAKLNIYLSTEGMCFVSDRYNGYFFSIDQSDIENALMSVSAANGFSIPIFHTLSEYYAAKYLNELDAIELDGTKDGKSGYYRLTDKAELYVILKMIKDEMNTAEYLVSSSKYWEKNLIGLNIYVKKFGHLIRVSSDDVIYLRSSRPVPFRMSKGFTEKLKKLIENSPTAVFKERELAFDDDDDVDDIVVVPDVEEECIDD